MGDRGEGWKAAAIDDIPPVKSDWPATWKSMRHHFGITAFGVWIGRRVRGWHPGP